MRIWIDLANSPHVALFRALVPEFKQRGHEVEITARDFAETVTLAAAANLGAQTIGVHGGRAVVGKVRNLLGRAGALRSWAQNRNFDLALSHNSYSQIVTARLLRLKTVTLMDYEHQPANHVAFRLASRIVVPQHFPAEALKRFGAAPQKVKRYHGTKEDVYLSSFEKDPEFSARLTKLGVHPDDVLVLVRPPADQALYHRFENHLFKELLEWLAARGQVKVLLLPRNEAQRAIYSAPRVIMPNTPIDGPNLIAASDLVISAGGTMNREAAALGVPAATIYAGRWAAVDEELCRSGSLTRLTKSGDFAALPLIKKGPALRRADAKVRREVLELVLNDW